MRMDAVTDTGALAVPAPGDDTWVMVTRGLSTLLLQPWLKADVAPPGMDVSEAVCTSSSGSGCFKAAPAFWQISCPEPQ